MEMAMLLAKSARSGLILVVGLVTFLAPSMAQENPPQRPAADDAALRSYRTATGLLGRGLHDLAAEEYRKFLDSAPGHEKAPVARYGLAVCLVKLQKFEDALTVLHAIDAGTDFAYRAETLALTGQCEMALGRPEKAIPAMERLTEEAPRHDLADDAAAMVVEALYQTGKTDDARKKCDEFTKRWPKSPLRERVDLVSGLSAAAGGDSAAAIERLEAWLTTFPQSTERPRAQLALGQALAATGKPE